VSAPVIPLLRPRLPDAEALLPYLRQIDQNGYYTNFGPLNSALLDRLTGFQQQRFGRHVFGVTTSSATLALELLITDLNLPVGSKVLLPSFTFLATATAVLRCGHVPVVADVDPQSWMLTPQSLPSTVKRDGIAAVMPVTVFGMPQSAKAWAQWREKTGIPVIIDAAGAFGAQTTDTNLPVAISLHATKCLSSGEGGLILTEDKHQAERLAQMTNFGIGTIPRLGGTNAKLSEYHAAVGHADLDVWPEKSQQRMQLHAFYHASLRHACGDDLGFQQDTGLQAPTTMVVRFADPARRGHIEQACAQEGVQTRRWYQPLIQDHTALTGVQAPYPTPCAHDLASSLLGIPFHLDMTQDDVNRVATILGRNTSYKEGAITAD
jgi:dTDP-4-amino-4,6-dideoxygalactose transaminase